MTQHDQAANAHVIRNGFVVDGSGAPGRVADLAWSHGVITAIEPPGLIPADASAREIDASGLLVTPGFVDVHTHYDAQATWDPYLTPSSWHGVTTAVMGNCGVGFAPAAADRHDWLIELMEGVEDIPGTALTEGITWGWESFEQYLDALDGREYVMDIGTQIPHGALRAYVMGDRGAANEAASGDDIAAMAALVGRAMEAGALGFSTSRTPLHRSKSGELVPGTTADADELIGIADALSAAGGGVFQFAPDHPDLPNEFAWMREVASRERCTVSVNLNQSDKAPDVWGHVLALLDEANDAGLPIVAQVHGRTVGLLMCLEGSYHPLMFHPAYQQIADAPLPDRVAALTGGPIREQLLDEVPDDGGMFQRAVIDGATKMWAVADGDIDYEPEAADSIAAIADRSGASVVGLIIDQLISADGHGMISTPFFNYSYGDLSFSYEAHMHPHTRMGLADAGAHVRVICDGGTPTFMLTHWTRDRTRGPKMPLERVIHRQTRETAELYGLGDRGLLHPGYRADINVIDYDRLTFTAPRMAHDLPGGAPRLVQKATGYRHTFVDGTETVTDDTFTGALPGRLLRGAR